MVPNDTKSAGNRKGDFRGIKTLRWGEIVSLPFSFFFFKANSRSLNNKAENKIQTTLFLL